MALFESPTNKCMKKPTSTVNSLPILFNTGSKNSSRIVKHVTGTTKILNGTEGDISEVHYLLGDMSGAIKDFYVAKYRGVSDITAQD